MAEHFIYSGSLPEGAHSYVTREADRDLYQKLSEGKFCYVLNTRQSGKSSLRVRTMSRLREEECACVAIDLTMIGCQLTLEQWYVSLLDTLIVDLGLDCDCGDWWESQTLLSPLSRFQRFIEIEILVRVNRPVVIFIDEIDYVLSLPFPTEDFFAFIRGCYNKRVDIPAYNRLTFCFLGVESPYGLMPDKQRTPFNIGKAITLRGFQFDEVSPLIAGLIGKVDDPDSVMREILYWTGGQPFLTQKLCHLIVENSESKTNIENLIKTNILWNWEAQDEPIHLRTIRDRVLDDDRNSGRLLSLYQQIIEESKVHLDGSSEQLILRLTGLVVQDQRFLQAHNPIYLSIFNSEWVEQNLARLRPYTSSLASWLASKGDETHLLRGEILTEVRDWASDKNLPLIDFRYLEASQEFESKQQLKREKTEAKRILDNANRAAKKRLGIALLISGIIISGSLVSLSLARAKVEGLQEDAKTANMEKIQAQSETRTANKDVKLARIQEQEAVNSAVIAGKNLKSARKFLSVAQRHLRTASLTVLKSKQEAKKASLQSELARHSAKKSRNEQLIAEQKTAIARKGIEIERDSLKRIEYFHLAEMDNFVKIMQNAIQLYKMVRNEKLLVKYPAFSPILALQKSLEKISQINQLDIPEKVLSVGYSSELKYIATGGNDGQVRLWDERGRPLANWDTNHGKILGISFSPNQKHFSTVGLDGNLYTWDFSGKKIATWKVHEGAATSVSYSPDGEMIATGGQDGFVRIWEIAGTKLKQWQAYKPGRLIHWSEVPNGVRLSFHKNGYQIATTGPYSGNNISYMQADGTWRETQVRIWNLEGEQQDSISLGKEIFGLSYSNKIDYLATADDVVNAAVRTPSGKLLTKFIGSRNGGVLDIEVGSDGRKLVTTGSDGIARIWDLQKKLKKSEVSWKAYEKGPRTSVKWDMRFSTDENILATLKSWSKTEIGKFRIWDLSLPIQNNLVANIDGVESFTFDRYRTNWILGMKNGNVQFWNLNGKKRVSKWPVHKGLVTSVSVSRNGKYLVSVGKDKIIRLWSLLGKSKPQLKKEWKEGSWALISPDAQHIAALNTKKYLRVWHISGELKFEKKLHVPDPKRIAFSPDGTLLAVSTDDSTAPVRIMNLSGKVLSRIIPPGQQRVAQVHFSSDGQKIITAGIDSDPSARLWSLTGQQVAQFDVHPSGSGPWVIGVSLSTDNKVLATMDDPYSRVRIWRVRSLHQLIIQGCIWLKDYQTSHPDLPKFCPLQK